MAHAKAGPRKTSRQVTLKLTEGEADLILGMTAQVGGHPTQSPRKYAERIRGALTEALGYGYEGTDAYDHSLGHIEFYGYDDEPVDPNERVEIYNEFLMMGVAQL
jgi:hypothetical protein